MPGGRPTKYTKTLLKKCWDYVQNFEEYGDVVPTNQGLRLVVGISIACEHDWSKQPEKTEFSKVLEAIKAKQHQGLINKGLSGEFNSAIAKLILVKHGYSEKQPADDKPTNITVVLGKSSDSSS